MILQELPLYFRELHCFVFQWFRMLLTNVPIFFSVWLMMQDISVHMDTSG